LQIVDNACALVSRRSICASETCSSAATVVVVVAAVGAAVVDVVIEIVGVGDDDDDDDDDDELANDTEGDLLDDCARNDAIRPLIRMSDSNLRRKFHAIVRPDVNLTILYQAQESIGDNICKYRCHSTRSRHDGR
jgi:hypothetical protein